MMTRIRKSFTMRTRIIHFPRRRGAGRTNWGRTRKRRAVKPSLRRFQTNRGARRRGRGGGSPTTPHR
eukprot:2380940-Heterocapsa_arctica.AAC.1